MTFTSKKIFHLNILCRLDYSICKVPYTPTPISMNLTIWKKKCTGILVYRMPTISSFCVGKNKNRKRKYKEIRLYQHYVPIQGKQWKIICISGRNFWLPCNKYLLCNRLGNKRQEWEGILLRTKTLSCLITDFRW